MKRIIGLILVIMLIAIVVPNVFALETCAQCGSAVVICQHCGRDCCENLPCRNKFHDCIVHVYDKNYPEEMTTNVLHKTKGTESYTITVPAKLTPGETGVVTAQGMWADDQILCVTSDDSVVLKNSINTSDTKTLNVTFDGIYGQGSNVKDTLVFTKNITVSEINNALFGTWSGHFDYDVYYKNQPAIGWSYDGHVLPYQMPQWDTETYPYVYLLKNDNPSDISEVLYYLFGYSAEDAIQCVEKGYITEYYIAVATDIPMEYMITEEITEERMGWQGGCHAPTPLEVHTVSAVFIPTLSDWIMEEYENFQLDYGSRRSWEGKLIWHNTYIYSHTEIVHEDGSRSIIHNEYKNTSPDPTLAYDE